MPDFKQSVLAEMAEAAAAAKLAGFEKLKEIHLSPEPFSPENGLLTPTFKLKRHQAKIAFQKEIDAMYNKGT